MIALKFWLVVLSGRVPNPEFLGTMSVNPSLGFRGSGFIACWRLNCYSLTDPGRAVQLPYQPVPLHRCEDTLAYTLTVKRQREQPQEAVCLRELAACVHSEERMLWRGALSSATETEHGSS